MTERMSTPADRQTSLTVRLSIDEREQLKQQAASQGFTLQQLFEHMMLGAAKPRRTTGRRPKPRQDQELHFDKSA